MFILSYAERSYAVPTALNADSKEISRTKGTLHAEYNSIDDTVLGPRTSVLSSPSVGTQGAGPLQSLKLQRFAPMTLVAIGDMCD